jgi:signal peptidase
MSAQTTPRTHSANGHFEYRDAVLNTDSVDGAEPGTAARRVHAVDLQETIDRLTGSIADVLAETDALRSEVAALEHQLAIAETALAESSRNADIVARITGLVQQVGGFGPPPVAPRIDEEPAAEADGLSDATAEPPSDQTPLSFLELRDILTAGTGISDEARPNADQAEAPRRALVLEAAAPVTLPSTPDTARKHWSPGRLAGRILAWASIGVVALAVGAVLLMTAGPRVLPYQTFYVFGRSMEPTIPLGSMVVLQPITFDQIKVGDVITVERPDAPGALVTHRVIDTEETPEGLGFITQGDANATPDPWRVHASGEGYRLRFSIPYLGYLLYTFQSPIGRLGLLIVPALVLGGLLMMQLWRPRRANQGSLATAS